MGRRGVAALISYHLISYLFVEVRGARLLFLPPYLPDFTPIKLAFSKLKIKLREAATRTREALTQAVRTALDWITAPDAQNWFDHYGYHVH